MAPMDDIEVQPQTEALLRQSQARLARAQQLGHLGYWEWDLQNQTLYWSDEVYRIFGVGRDFALTYDNIESMVHPEDREANTQYVQALFTTSSEVEFEFRIVRPRGEIRHIVQTAQVERDEAGQPLNAFGIMQDVTERRRTEQALQRSQSELEAVYEHAPVMMCLLGPHREVLYANRAFVAFTGVPEAELVQGRACGVFGCINALEHPEGCGYGSSCRDCQIRLAIEDTLATGQGHRDVEYHATLERAGVRRDVVLLGATARIESGEARRVLLCLENITERRRAERQSEAAFTSMRDAMRHTVRNHRLLLALNQASQAVQRARAPEAIYCTVGEEVRNMGYHATILTPGGAPPELTVVYTSFSPAQIHPAEQLIGSALVGYHFQPEPGGFFARAMAEGKALLCAPNIEAVIETLPEKQRPLARRLATTMGVDKVKILLAPLKIEDRIEGMLVVTGDDLTEDDAPAMEAFANQASIALENAQSLEQVQAGRERMRQLTRQIVQAQEEERKHIAQELHDELGQTITAISFDLAAIAAALPPELAPTVGAHLTEAQVLTDQLDERVGELALNLRPAILDDLGLAPALRWFVKGYTARLKIAVALEIAGLEMRLAPEVEITLYRVVQEALTNVSKHARATEVRIALQREAGRITLSVEDNGQGFALDNVAGGRVSGRGVGLLGMQERVAAVGGAFSAQTGIGQGTRLAIEIPL